jgi:hypothetical protein
MPRSRSPFLEVTFPQLVELHICERVAINEPVKPALRIGMCCSIVPAGVGHGLDLLANLAT